MDNKIILKKLLNQDLDIVYDEKLITNKEELHNLILEEINKNNQSNKKNIDTEIINDYRIFLIKLLELLDYLKLKDNDLLCAMAINYLIKYGYMSYSNKYKFSACPKEIYRNYGINIIYGEFCCRHIANFYQDLMKVRGNNFLTFTGRISRFKMFDVNKRLHHNHMINLINYHDEIYGYDISNNNLACFINPYQMQIENNYRKLYFTYKSYYDTIYYGYDIETIKKNLKLFQNNILNNSLNYEILNCYCNYINSYLEGKDKILRSFSSNTNKLKEDIKTKILTR